MEIFIVRTGTAQPLKVCCTACRQVVTTGMFGVAVKMPNGTSGIVRDATKTQCPHCGQEQNFPKVYDQRNEAEEVKARLLLSGWVDNALIPLTYT